MGGIRWQQLGPKVPGALLPTVPVGREPSLDVSRAPRIGLGLGLVGGLLAGLLGSAPMGLAQGADPTGVPVVHQEVLSAGRATPPAVRGPWPSAARDSLGASAIGQSLRSSWARGWGGGPSASRLTLTYPGGSSGLGPGRGLTYYPSGGVRTVDGLGLSQQQAFLYGVRKFELNRGQTALKGAALTGKMGLFAGAMASSFGWLSESEALWLAGGVAALGAAYGAAVGYESTAFREEWRWPRMMDEEAGIHIHARAR